jgi:hypothetical protein
MDGIGGPHSSPITHHRTLADTKISSPAFDDECLPSLSITCYYIPSCRLPSMQFVYRKSVGITETGTRNIDRRIKKR